MKHVLGAVALSMSLVAAPAYAASLLPDFTAYTLVPLGPPASTGAKLGAGGTTIDFASKNTSSATASGISLVNNQQYTLSLTGQDENDSSFLFKFLDASLNTVLQFAYDFSGFGNGPNFTQNFTFLGLTGTYSFKIMTVSTDKSYNGHISAASLVTVTTPPEEGSGPPVGVPGPVAGAGIPALLAFGGYLFRRRRVAA